MVQNFEVFDHYFTIAAMGSIFLGDMRKLPGFGGEIQLEQLPLQQDSRSLTIKTQSLNPTKKTIFAGGQVGDEDYYEQACYLINAR